ncbi:MAG: polysaccharide deacetylase family protein [bacterium]
MMWIYVLVVVVLLLLAALSRWNWWRLPAGGVPILMYHKIGDPPENSSLKKLWVSKNKFIKQLAYLKKRNYKTITFEEIAQGKICDASTVIITFDDGYRNNYEIAAPLLKEFGYTGVFFVAVEALGKDNFWHNPAAEARIPMMNTGALLHMIADGHEIGSHTLTHPNLERVGDTTLYEEIVLSKKKLSELVKKQIVSFAYPYGKGAYTDRVQAVMKNSGYSYACSIKQGKADLGASPYQLKRLLIRGDDTMFDFHLNLTRGKSRF